MSVASTTSSLNYPSLLSNQLSSSSSSSPPPPGNGSTTVAAAAPVPKYDSVYAQVYRQIDSIKKAKVVDEMMLRERDEQIGKLRDELNDMYQREIRYKVAKNTHIS